MIILTLLLGFFLKKKNTHTHTHNYNLHLHYIFFINQIFCLIN